MVVLNVGCCAQAFSGCSEWPLLSAAHRLLAEAAALVAEHGLGTEASVAAACRLSSGAVQVQLFCGT